MAHTSMIQTSIKVPFAYSIHFTRDVFSPENPTLHDILVDGEEDQRHRFLVFVDAGVAEAHPHIVDGIVRYAQDFPSELELAESPLVVPGGEAAKNSFETPLRVIRLARQAHLCRHSHIVAVGGGAMIDAVGFAASMIHRGVRVVRVPTTVLAQNDSGVGVKNSVNLRGVKNFLGTFAPPAAVVNDSSFLRTLSTRDWIAGIAEAYKVGSIKDREFLDWLDTMAIRLRNRELEPMTELIHRCAHLHVQHIATSGDPFEFGSARPLDFGHWAAHKLESLTLNELRHGEAVAVGMALDLLYAAKRGFIDCNEAYHTIRSMARVGLPVWHETLDMRDAAGRLLVLNGIEEFREHLGGKLHVTLPCPLGSKREVQTLNEQDLTECVKELREWAAVSNQHAN
ncbi:MAG: 3-dehydroquinate synthase [Candidatus Pacebacteria bacterium]|nr:3-dehydroquinate synthase [Candidatus Paceibacterota bacterium]